MSGIRPSTWNSSCPRGRWTAPGDGPLLVLVGLADVEQHDVVARGAAGPRRPGPRGWPTWPGSTALWQWPRHHDLPVPVRRHDLSLRSPYRPYQVKPYQRGQHSRAPVTYGPRSVAFSPMELADAVRRRRMVRSFSGRPVPAARPRRACSSWRARPRRPATPGAGTPSSSSGPRRPRRSGTPPPPPTGGPAPGGGRACARPGGGGPVRRPRRLPGPLPRARQGRRAGSGPPDGWRRRLAGAVLVRRRRLRRHGHAAGRRRRRARRLLPRELPGRGGPAATRSAFPTTAATSAPCSWASPAGTTPVAVAGPGTASGLRRRPPRAGGRGAPGS